jgi:XapX domain-containing protein
MQQYIYVGRTEITALVVGLVTGFIYSLLDLPIPAPNVLGGILAIIFTYIGLVIVQVIRKEAAFGPPPRPEVDVPPGAHLTN